MKLKVKNAHDSNGKALTSYEGIAEERADLLNKAFGEDITNDDKKKIKPRKAVNILAKELDIRLE